MMTHLSINRPLKVDADIFGNNILSVEQITVNRDIETLHTICGPSVNIPGQTTVNGSMMVIIKQHNALDSLVKGVIEKLHLVFNDDYYVLKDFMVSGYSSDITNITNDGSLIVDVDFIASDIEMNPRMDIKFKDGVVANIWASDYVMISKRYWPPEEMTEREYFDRLVLEAL